MNQINQPSPINQINQLKLTSSQAASLLQVHESSMKRWANEGRFHPENTKGGHRRINLPDLLRFVKKERQDSTLLRFAPHEEEMAEAAIACREKNNFELLIKLIVKFCDTKSPAYIVDMTRYLNNAFGIPVTRVFDLGIAPALKQIGQEWIEGVRTIAHEHRFTQKVLDALYGLSVIDIHEQKPTAPIALVGCAESCYHEIGSMFVRLALEEAGWQVCYLGGNVPFDEFAGIQAELNAKLVAISFVPPCGTMDAKRCATILNRLYRDDKPYFLVVGGSGITETDFATDGFRFQSLKVSKDTESLHDWAKSKLHSQRDEIKET